MNQNDYFDAGFRVFGIHPIQADGSCGCGREDCQAAGKHPIASNWQATPEWSDEQLETMELMDHFKTGFGVLVKERLVVDVDARNGGVESFQKLCADLELDILGEAGFAVATGSGGGSMHLYFAAPKGVSLLQKLHEYKGIDFKSSGFVIGAGSMHASGNCYEEMHGHPDDVGPAPQALIELLTRQEHFRADVHGETVDITEAEIADMLSYVDYNADHDTWVSCGMAVHHATGGSGFSIWDEWSSKGDSYPGRNALSKRWHSFGKSANPVTLGTLIFHAESAGWEPSVTFTPTVDFDEEEAPAATLAPKARKPGDHPFHIDGVDLLRPPGFVGDVCKWINAQSRFPRENLSVAAALVAVGNVAGLRYTDDIDGVTTNLFAMCVAGSATGKEAVQQAVATIHRAANIQVATHGRIKSDKEILENLISNQAAFYVIDEFGIELSKITKAVERGGASYLESVVGTLMSAYSKADSFMLLSGDMRRAVKVELKNQLNSIKKAIGENEDPTGALARRQPQLQRALESIDNGLEKPFLSLMGFTTPVTFDSLVTYEQATNGFIGRSIIVVDKETNPRAKPGYRSQPMASTMQMTIAGLYDGGYFDGEQSRVEFYGDRTRIPTEKAAAEMLEAVAEWAYETAEIHKQTTGLEAIPRRAREMVSKISLILAAPGKIRTAEHVRWAYAFVQRDVETKCRLAFVNSHGDGKGQDQGQAIMAKIMGLIDRDHGETTGVIVNRCRKWGRVATTKALEELEKKGKVFKDVSKHPVNGAATEKWFARDE